VCKPWEESGTTDEVIVKMPHCVQVEIDMWPHRLDDEGEKTLEERKSLMKARWQQRGTGVRGCREGEAGETGAK